MQLFELFFPQFCKSDMSRYGSLEFFRESLGIQDNESRLYIKLVATFLKKGVAPKERRKNWGGGGGGIVFPFRENAFSERSMAYRKANRKSQKFCPMPKQNVKESDYNMSFRCTPWFSNDRESHAVLCHFDFCRV